MASDLKSMKCKACEGGVDPLTLDDAEVFLKQTPKWEIDPDKMEINRTYSFANFYETMAFVISNCKSRIDLLRRFAISCILAAHRRPATQRSDASNMKGASTHTQATFPKDDLVRTDAMRVTTRRLTTPNLSYYAIQRQLATQPELVLTTESGVVKLLKRYDPGLLKRMS